MDAFDDAVQRLQRDVDNLRQLGPQGIRDGNGPGNGDDGDGDGPPPPPPPPRNPNIRIAGIEVTQGIQFFNFNGQGTGLMPDNSLLLVHEKTTVVRVYVDCRTISSSFPTPANITGICIPALPNTFPLDLINGPIVARAANQIDRSNANHTLNFRLDGWRCKGRITFVVIVWDSTRTQGDADWATFASETFVSPGFTFLLPLFGNPKRPVFAVRIIYTGPDPTTGAPMNLDPPTETEVANTLHGTSAGESFVTKVFPTSGIDYHGSTTRQFGGNLRADGAGGCGTGWNALLTMLSDMRSASSSHAGDVWVGVLPAGTPTGGVIGCGGGGVAAGRVGDQNTFAEEIGHAYGRLHAPACSPAPGTVDTSYPTYALSNGTFLTSGSIGEFGFDTTTGAVRNPSTTSDFMGACPPAFEWVSEHTWRNLFAQFVSFFPSSAAAPAPLASTEEAPLAREHLILNFRMYRDGDVELLPSFHLPGAAPMLPSDEEAPIVVELRAADGRGVGFHRCHLNDPYADPDSPYQDFHEVIRWEQETTSIAFLRDEDEVQIIEVEERAPQITSRPVAEREGDRVTLAWEAQHDQNRITYLVRYSNDGGNTWLAVAAGLTEPRFVADLADLPGGEDCLFQVAASSTIRTTVAEAQAMAVSVKPRRPYILSPEPNSRFSQGEPVRLGGVGFSPDFQTAPLDEVVWISNVDGFLGYGHNLITQALTPGLHKITLSVADGLGGEASESLLIKIRQNE
jgi:hypothetical protein